MEDHGGTMTSLWMSRPASTPKKTGSAGDPLSVSSAIANPGYASERWHASVQLGDSN